jgi:hypothetical protein
MFAVILLGIGFIMVAAMFPIAIQQSRSSTEETGASVVARAAIAHLAQVATEQTMPGQDNLVQFKPELWSAIRGAAIDQTDPRYAWVAVHRRPANSATAQVYVIVLQVRNHSAFNLNDIQPITVTQPTTMDYPASIEPKRVRVAQARDNNGDPLNRFQIQDQTGAPMPAAAEGAYVILSTHDDGRVVRLGNALDLQNAVYELAPGNDRIATPIPSGQYAEGFMVGRGYHPDTPNPSANPPTFEGPAMDIAVFTGFVKVK